MRKIDSNFIESTKNIFEHKKCVFIVGAGISVASGIPDFRSPTGIFASLRQDLKINGKNLFTYNFGIREGSRQIYLKYISTLKKMCDSAVPNRTHHFLANYPRARIYTQNIDGLEEKQGMVFVKNETTRGIYLHGNLLFLACQYCGFRKEFQADDVAAFENGQEIYCRECAERAAKPTQNRLRTRPIYPMHPAIIHYQQVHPDAAFIGKMCQKDLDCDLLIVMGTSLAVEGVKKLVKMFCRNQRCQGKRIFVNLTKPNKEWEDYFDYFFEGDCNEFVKTVEAFTKMNKYEEKDIKSELIDVKSEVIKEMNSKILDVKEMNSQILDVKEIISIQNSEGELIATENISFLEERNESEQKGKLNSFEEKLESLIKSFSDEEMVSMPVLESALKESLQTEIKDSNCLDLQEEIEMIVSKSFQEVE